MPKVDLTNKDLNVDLPNKASKVDLSNKASKVDLPNKASKVDLPNKASKVDLSNKDSKVDLSRVLPIKKDALMTRLQAICSLINKCNTFADIGCDHGFISKFVLDNDLAKRVITTDISEKCLLKAKKLLIGYKNVEFICTDGLSGVSADTAVIAGLGGLTIIDILDGRLDGTIYILQPQDHASNLRFFLTQNGYRIESDFVVRENSKYYDVMLCMPGMQQLDELSLNFGVNYKAGAPLLVERLNKEYKKFSSYNDGGKNEEKRALLKKVLEQIGELSK